MEGWGSPQGWSWEGLWPREGLLALVAKHLPGLPHSPRNHLSSCSSLGVLSGPELSGCLAT